MASEQQRTEHDATATQGKSGGTGDNNLQRLAESLSLSSSAYIYSPHV